MAASVSAQQPYVGNEPADWDGTVTTSSENSSLQGDSAQTGGDALDEEKMDVNVTVTSLVEVDVKPDTLNYPRMQPGSQETVSNRTFESVTLINTGSEYIDRVWANASVPDSDPFGVGNAQEHNAGNFIQIKPQNLSGTSYSSSIEGNQSTYHYVNRKDYMFDGDEETPDFIRASGDMTDAGGSDPADVEVGAFRVRDKEFYFALLQSSDESCTGTGNSQLRVANTPSTDSQIGTYDFTDDGPPEENPDYTNYSTSKTESVDLGITSSTVNLQLSDDTYREYDVLLGCEGSTEFDDTFTVRTRYNVNYGGIPDLVEGDGTKTQFLFSADSSNEDNLLDPGSLLKYDTALEVPRGVSQGSVSQGSLNFLVTSDNNPTDGSVEN